MFRPTLAFVLAFAVAQPLAAQQAEDRTLLSPQQMRDLIEETSGERPLHTVLELVPYQRVRPLSEYGGNFHESEVAARLAREAGYSDVRIESFAAGQQLWQPTRGELWMVEPVVRKLYDIHDVAISLAPNSESGEVTAELVDVGSGTRPEDFEGRDVRGKIVLGSNGVGSLQRLGVFERGAVGVLGAMALRPIDYPDIIFSQSIGIAPQGQGGGFGWAITPRVAAELRTLLDRGEKVVLRSIVKAETFPGELEVVHAMIPGDGSTDQAVAVSAHIYEGYIKQGANDDNSGVALTLEMGRVYLRLIAEGKLPRPKRDIHFVWASEISGTNAWLNAHPDLAKRMIADLNFDMEGIGLRASGAYWLMHRTPDTFPTYLNDIGQSFLEYVAELNRERVRYRAAGYAPTLPIYSPNGTRDPFYAMVDEHYGSSDHVTYMQHGIASVIFNTWPDMWYHSSADTPDKMDPTQFRRAAVVGIGSMVTLAAADDALALRVAGESMGRGTERLGAAHRKGLGYMADVTDGGQLAAAYREARNAVAHQAAVERAVVLTTRDLFTTPAAAGRVAALAGAVDRKADALQAELAGTWRAAAAQWGVQAKEPAQTALEREASRLVAARVGGARGGPRGPGAASDAPPADRAALQAAQTRFPQHMNSELNILLTKNLTVSEIRDFLSGEFEPLPLEDLMALLRAQEKLGSVTLSAR
ncbi:MAG: M28 family peptidase [Gemmatimonadaceae bacterium]